jgi:general secretion pathway protein G
MKRTPYSRRRSGFTLLEILLVVGLLALLASFAIPALMGQGENAKKDMAKAAIGPNGTISQAIKLYKFHTGSYPEELKFLIEKPGDSDIAKKWNGPYLEDEAGLQDAWGKEFQYRAPGQHNEGGFDLWSMGPDGQDGTDDDIVNWKTDR